MVGVEQDDGGYWMPLFVSLVDGAELDERLRSEIVAAIRRHASRATCPTTSWRCRAYRGR